MRVHDNELSFGSPIVQPERRVDLMLVNTIIRVPVMMILLPDAEEPCRVEEDSVRPSPEGRLRQVALVSALLAGREELFVLVKLL